MIFSFLRDSAAYDDMTFGRVSAHWELQLHPDTSTYTTLVEWPSNLEE